MQTIYQTTFSKWHKIMKSGDTKALNEILADDVVFHSPVVWTPQRGKKITALYLQGASFVLKDGFTYTREIYQDNQCMLEFQCKIGAVTVEGVDIIELNDEGKIISFKVLVRPLKAVHAIHQAMGAMLNKLKP